MNSEELRVRPVRNWRSRILVGLSSIAIAATNFTTPANATDPAPITDTWQAAAEAASATPAELRAEVADGELRMIVVRDDLGQPDVTVVSVTNAKQLDQTLTAIKKDPSVISVDVDQKVNLLAGVTLPTLATVVPAYTQWNYSALRLGEINTFRTGTGITVAVIDTGVNRTGTDLDGTNPKQVLDGCDWVTSPTNVCTGTGVTDENGHGTHVAGIIAAQNDGEGITGVAPGSTILPLRVLDASGSGYLSDIAAAIEYAVANGAKVINMSLGGTVDYYLIRNAVDRALAAGVIVVVAAGNSGPTNTLPSYPAAYESVIAVAATDRNGVVASYSNQGSYLDIAAPGSAITSTYKTGYASLSGTSMASPHIAGVVALMLESGVSVATIKTKLQDTADKISPHNDTNRYGAGLVNAYEALNCAVNACNAPSPPPTPVEVLTETKVINPGIVTTPTTPPADPVSTPEPAPIVEAAPVVVVPTIKETLAVKVSKKRKLTVAVTAPADSKTWVQRKVGKKWKTVIKITTTPSIQVKLSRSGTYRVQIIAPNEKVTSKSYKVK